MNFDEQLSTEKTLVHILQGDSFTLPQELWKVVGGYRDLERLNLFTGPV